MSEEVWKPIPSLPGFMASADGRVRSPHGRVLASRPLPKSGYMMVSIKLHRKCLNRYVHRLVAEAFLGTDPAKPEVNHISGLKADNRLENLEWCSRQQNIDHARHVLKTWKVGSARRDSKLTEDIVRAAREEYRRGGTSTRLIGLKYGVTQAVMCAAINGKSWSHVA